MKQTKFIRQEKQAYKKGIVDTLLVITEFSFFSYMIIQVFVKICN